MRTILLADDELNLRRLVRATLEDPAYRIVEASNGPQALELVRREHPDLLLLDWMMPGMSGIELVETLRADRATRGLRIVMLTAKGQSKDRQRAMAAGCQHLLVKPFSPLELLSTVRMALDGDALPADWKEETVAPPLTPELLSKLERADQQLALYARDLKRAHALEQARSRELAEANGRLESLSRLKTEFLSFISHELRTPLNAMAVLDLLDPSSDAREQAEVIELVRSGYDRLHRFVERVLEYFDWLAMDEIATTETTDLAALLAEVEASLPELRGPEVRYESRSDGTAPRIRGGSAGLGTVVRALLENALEFSPQEKNVAARLRTQGGDVILSVSDRGMGMGAPDLEAIFRPFRTADTSHPYTRRGLSLALAKVIVEAHGGKIRAESDGPGRGSTFTVELPLASRPAPAGP